VVVTKAERGCVRTNVSDEHKSGSLGNHRNCAFSSFSSSNYGVYTPFHCLQIVYFQGVSAIFFKAKIQQPIAPTLPSHDMRTNDDMATACMIYITCVAGKQFLYVRNRRVVTICGQSTRYEDDFKADGARNCTPMPRQHPSRMMNSSDSWWPDSLIPSLKALEQRTRNRIFITRRMPQRLTVALYRNRRSSQLEHRGDTHILIPTDLV